jgi:hypothetical protein
LFRFGLGTCSGELERRSALIAQFHARWILESAFPAFHGVPRRNGKKWPYAEVLICEETQRDGMKDDYPERLIVLT